MTPRTLSLSELNRIASEFGLEFEQPDMSPSETIYIRPKQYLPTWLADFGPILADRCEEASSPWCEVIRSSIGVFGYHLFLTKDFAIVE